MRLLDLCLPHTCDPFVSAYVRKHATAYSLMCMHLRPPCPAVGIFVTFWPLSLQTYPNTSSSTGSTTQTYIVMSAYNQSAGLGVIVTPVPVQLIPAWSSALTGC